MEQVIEATLLVLGAREVKLAWRGGKHMGVFVKALRDRRGFLEFDWSRVDKVDKVKYICILEPLRGERRDRGKELSITRCNLLRINGKKGGGGMDT